MNTFKNIESVIIKGEVMRAQILSIFFIISVLCLFSNLNASCTYGASIDQQQAAFTNTMNIPTRLYGTGYYPRLFNILAQTFKPAVSGEMYQIDMFGKKNFGSTDENVFEDATTYGCTSTAVDAFGIDSGFSVAQKFTYTTGMYSLQTIRFKLYKDSPAPTGDLFVFIEADNAGIPSGIPLTTGFLSLSDVWNSVADGFITYDANFNVVPTLTNGVSYWIVFLNNGASGLNHIYEFQGDYSSDCNGQPIAIDSGGGWYTVPNMMLHLELNRHGYHSNYACVSIFDGITFLGAQEIEYPSSPAGWSSSTFSGLWCSNFWCSSCWNPTGPTISAGHTYNIWVTTPDYGDSEQYYSTSNPYANGYMLRDYFAATSWTTYASYDLTFRTEMCNAAPTPTPSVTPFPSPTPTVSPTPTPSVTPFPSPTVSPTPTPSPGVGLCNSGQKDGSCNLGDYCVYTADCHVGLRCNDANLCEKLMTSITAWGETLFGLSVNFLELGLFIVLGVSVILLLMSRRDDMG